MVILPGPPATRRLTLLPVTPLMKLAMQSSRAAFADLAGVSLPEGWPEFPQAFSDCAETPDPWHGYLFVRRDDSQLVGNGGFVGPPGSDGSVEVGYEIAPELRNQGYATEAAAGLVELAFTHGVRAVTAHSLPWPNASTAVMQKLGMTRRDEVTTPEGVIWRWGVEGP
jgi:[ribosomal protein S5]-alanine N-acetyltransferase